MNISYNWLKEYVNFDLTPDETADALTSIGLETGGVEEVQTIKGGLEGLVIGEVLTCTEHPNSDHLHITTVNLGDGEPVQIVCGAPNVAAGQKVVVATLGTKLYDGDECFTIKKSKIRGVESTGMICAEDEIGIGTDHAGIIVLPENAVPGTLAKDYYNIKSDYVLEVDITPNRADACSHYGVARDLYAYLIQNGKQATLQRPSVDGFKVENHDLNIEVKVENSEACPHYAGVTVKGVTVKESPEWLQNKLRLIGVRPINNVVDITNYIVHAFHFPNDLPFRFSFIYSFVLLSIAYKAIVNIKSFSTKALLGSGVATVLFAVLVQRLGSKNVTETSIYLSIAFVAVYAVVLGLMKKKNYAQSAVSLLLMCCVFAEVAVSDTSHFVMSQQKPNFVNGYTEFRELKEKLDTVEGTDKYRMELTNINTLMDASWFNYNGVSVFSSMAYEKSANLQHNLGLNSNYINSYIYAPQTPVYNAMMSLKYLVNNDDSIMNDRLFEKVAENDRFVAYRNNYCLPIAYSVSEEVEKWITTGSNPFEIQNDYWTRATDAGDVFKRISATTYSTKNIRSDDELLTENFSYNKEITGQEGSIVIKYEIPESQNVYLYTDCKSADTINVSGTNGFSKSQDPSDPYVLDCGYLEKGEILTLEITIPSDKESGYADIYAVGLDMNNFEAGYNKLAASAMDISEFTDTHIKGTVNVKANELVYTSINYDEGWEITVDGEKVEPVALGDALIGIDAAPGTHTIEMTYKPKGFMIGAVVSAGTLVAFIVALIVIHIIKKKRYSKSIEIDSKETVETSTDGPTGIDALMEQDLGKDATVEDVEKLLDVPDEYEMNKQDPTETLNRADEILNTQKINLKEILSQIEGNDDSEDKE